MEHEHEHEGELTHLKKAAIVLSSLPEDVASQVLRYMGTDEIEKLTGCMTAMKMVPSEVVEKTVGDFLQMATEEAGALSLGKGYVETLISKSFGEDKAKAIVNKVSRSGETRSLELLETFDSETLSDLTRNEHPQTIALILSQLSPEKSGSILSSLPEELRTDVILRISNLDRVSPDVVNEIAEMLESEAKSRGSAGQEVGGIKTVADILNQLDPAMEQALIGKIEEDNPKMADEIRQLMFVFEDLALLDDRGIQEVLKEVSSEDLARALKTASEEVKEKIFKNMSERAVTMLNEDIEDMGPIRLSEVERAQQAITQVVLRLEEEGKIETGGRGGEEVFV